MASSSTGFLSSMTPSGRPLTNSTTSGRRVFLFSVTVNWLTASQLLAAGSSKSTTRACAPRTAPPSVRCSTVTPSTSIRWKARLRASSVAPSGRVSLRKASSSASAGRPGFSLAEGVPQPPLQHDLAVVATLGARRIRRHVRPVHDLPADIAQPVEGRFLNVGFGDGHGVSQGLTILTSNPPKSLTLRVATDRSFVFAVPAMRASASCNAQPSRCARAWNVAAHSAS